MSSRETVFVTGGSGFVGSHVVRRLADDGYRVRMLVRRPGSAAPHPSVEFVTGDLTQAPSYQSALAGAAAVIHAALTDNLAHDVEATVELRNRSAQAGVRKFLHLSTISVYGNPLEGTITEDMPPIQVNDPYALTKLAIEERLKADSSMAETVILRLGCVYGPGGGWWTDGLLNLMKRGRLILVNHGAGTANLIHVLDIAAMVPLLLARSNPPCEVFNVTDGTPVNWSVYFRELERLLGRSATVSMSEAEARAYGKNWLHPSLPRRVIRKLQGARFIHPLDDRGIAGFVSRAGYSNQKACQLLGFRPVYTLESGMRTILPPKP
ncbi:MAG TPA: NAD(P)-dependent oxidoreductase [Bryobacteraceae bacterium]|nr:NAD(P)-dependent oxidoreductase [Bryobacteraceae bacterium]